MSEHLAAAAAAVGGPEELVARSAAARAQAEGVSVDDILQAWAGGTSVATAAPAAAATEAAAPKAPPAESTSEAAAPSEPEPAPPVTATVPVGAEAVSADIAAAVMSEPVEPEFEAAPIGERFRLPGRLGALLGAMLGMFALVASTPWLFDKVALAGTDDDPTLIWQVAPGRFVLGAAAVSALFGAIIARLSGTVPAWFDKGLSVRTTGRSLVIVGAGLGAVLGVVAAGVLLGMGSPVEVLPEEPALTQISIIPTLVLVLVGGAFLGAVVSIAAQVVALPDGLSEREREESEVIKHRLGTSYMMPLMVVLAIVLLVVPFGLLLVEFASVAPLIAIITAGGILTFASLSASRPGMKVTVTEALVAAAGIGTVVLFIVLVANATGGGGHG